MSFFGFDTTLERDSRKFAIGEDEDLAVYTFGEEGYDGLADALDEGLDDLNDETFGGSGAVGKDFDFTSQALPPAAPALKEQHTPRTPVLKETLLSHHHTPRTPSTSHASAPNHSLESIWADKPLNPLSHNRISSIGSTNGDSRARKEHPAPSTPLSSSFSPFNDTSHASPFLPSSSAQPRVYTLQEIEAEQRASAQRARVAALPSSPQPVKLPPAPFSAQELSIAEYEHQQALLRVQQAQQQEQLQLQLLQRQEEELAAQQLAIHQRIAMQQQQQQQQHLAAEQFAIQQQQQFAAQRFHAQSLGIPPPVGVFPPTEFPDPGHILDPEQREAVTTEAMRKIMEAERLEQKRRRKLAKIARMSKYNDLMTQSDKDFITRIQVSQLVTQDPYAEDFYAQVFGAIQRSRMGLAGSEAVLNFGAGGGVGVGLPGHRGSGRRENALQRMQAQVERIVSNAKSREKEKGSQVHLQGALGRVSGRSYKAAPRQLLQVDSGVPSSPNLSSASPANSHNGPTSTQEAREEAAKEAAKYGREALGGGSSESVSRQPALTKRQVLVAIESLYDTVLQAEQIRREQPPPEEEEEFQKWNVKYSELIEKLWSDCMIMIPLETSDPHPFVSLITPAKGKRLLPRLLRLVSPARMNLFFTLLVACFSQLDVVRNAALLDDLRETPEKADVEKQTEVFLGAVVPLVLSVVKTSALRFVSGMLGLLFDTSDLVAIAKTRPGITLLTILLSRVADLKEVSAAEADGPSPEDMEQWQSIFDHLFQILSGHLLFLFPSTRLAAALPFGSAPYQHLTKSVDVADQPVWHFLAALALNSSMYQQQALVAEVREKVLENIVSANRGWIADENERHAKIANVNLFLHALGLDSSQIAL